MTRQKRYKTTITKEDQMPISTLNTGISDEGRKAVANGLSNVLADTFCLYEKHMDFIGMQQAQVSDIAPNVHGAIQ